MTSNFRPYLLLTGLILLGLSASAAAAERWVLVRPIVVDGGSPRFADALARGLQAGLNQHGGRQVGDMLGVDELSTVLDCLELTPNCAERAARSVNADGTLYATVRQVGDRALVEINRVGIRRRQTLGWRIDFRGQRLNEIALERLGDALGYEAFADDPVHSGLFSPGRQTVEFGRRARTVDGLLRAPSGTYAVAVGPARLRIDLLPGEIVVLPLQRPASRADAPPQDVDLRVPGYIALGLSGIGLLVAGGTAVQMNDTRQSYQTATTGARVRQLNDQGTQQAGLINLMLISSSALAVTGLVLLLID